MRERREARTTERDRRKRVEHRKECGGPELAGRKGRVHAVCNRSPGGNVCQHASLRMKTTDRTLHAVSALGGHYLSISLFLICKKLRK